MITIYFIISFIVAFLGWKRWGEEIQDNGYGIWVEEIEFWYIIILSLFWFIAIPIVFFWFGLNILYNKIVPNKTKINEDKSKLF